jgi:ribosomal protein S18 acetylase RimI-like enzyme
VADVSAVRRLLVETWHATYDATICSGYVTEITNTWHAIPVLRVQIEEPGCSFLIAEQAGAIVGHINTREQPQHTLYLGRLYVHLTSQRQGIGRCLLHAAQGRHPTATRVWLTVAADNAPAIAFYHRDGFAVAGEAREPDGHRVLHMERSTASVQRHSDPGINDRMDVM